MSLAVPVAKAQSRFLALWPLAAILAAWVPILFLVSFSDFAFQNDYVSATARSSNLAVHPEGQQLLTVGRPIGAMLLQLYHRTFDSVGAMAVARTLGVGLGILLSVVIYVYLRRSLSVDRALATATAIGLPMLPSVLIGVLWVTTQPPGLLCIVYVSSLYAVHATTGARFPKGWMLLLPAWLAAFFVYQPSALFVCALILARLMFAEPGSDGGRAVVRAAAIEVATVAAVMVAYLIFAKALYDPLMGSFGVNIVRTMSDASLAHRYDFQLAAPSEMIAKTLGFLTVAMRLWVIDDRGIASLTFAALAVLGIAGQVRRFGLGKTGAMAVALMGALPIFAIAPVAVSNFESFAYRASAAAQACLAIMAFRGLGECMQFWVAWRRRSVGPGLGRRVVISAAPPAVAGMLVVTSIATWQIKPVIDDKVAELTFATATIQDHIRRFGAIPPGTRAEAVLNIADKGKDARAPYYDLGLAGRDECCWGYLALAGVDRYLALKAEGKVLEAPPVEQRSSPVSLIFDFRGVPPLP